MITIKFRGKDIETGEWLYGDLIQRMGYYPAILTTYPTDEGKVGYAEIAVKEDTVGQFTGLKDKNGREIYEGDAIECGLENYVCEFVEGGFVFRNTLDGKLTLNAIVIHSRIIGNIHDNPELLKLK